MENSLRTRLAVKNTIKDLQQQLALRTTPTVAVLDIMDVLAAVTKRIDTTSQPVTWVHQLINYMNTTAAQGQLSFTTTEAALIAQLATFGQQVTTLNQATTTDKAQFYGYYEEVPRH